MNFEASISEQLLTFFSEILLRIQFNLELVQFRDNVLTFFKILFTAQVLSHIISWMIWQSIEN